MTVPVATTLDRLDRAASLRIEGILRTAVPTVAPAAAVVVMRGDTTVLEMAAGSVGEESPTPVAAETHFDLASLTKLFTTTTFLGLVSEGRVSLGEPVGSVIPELTAGGPRGMDGGQEPLSRRLLPTPRDLLDRVIDPATVTFRQLLTHTSGLAPWRAIFQVTVPVPPPEGLDQNRRRMRRAAGLEAICTYPFVAEPGVQVRYSDLGFMLVGEAVVRLTGSSLEVALKERVLDRLGLASVTFLPLQAGHARTGIAPTSFDDDWRHRRLWGEVEDENAAGLGGVAGHAGLFAPARDVAALGQAWLLADPRLAIRPDLLAEATRNLTSGLGEARGLGWQVQPADHLTPLGPRAYGHTGFTGTSLAVDPDRGLVVALLTDRVYAARTHPGIDELRLAVHTAVASL